AVLTLFVNGAVIFVPGVHAARRGTKNHARLRAQLTLENQAGLRHRLTRGQQRELGELIVKNDLLTVEIGLWLPVADLTADADRQPLDIAELQRADAAAPFPHGLKR